MSPRACPGQQQKLLLLLLSLLGLKQQQKQQQEQRATPSPTKRRRMRRSFYHQRPGVGVHLVLLPPPSSQAHSQKYPHPCCQPEGPHLRKGGRQCHPNAHPRDGAVGAG